MSTPRMIRAAWAAILLLALSTHAAAQQARPRILLTNDDGIEARGIAVMAEELARFADVVVVAPVGNSSGASHSSVIRTTQAELTPLMRDGRLFGYALNATPADCTKFGLLHFGRERPFDLVVSGINAGANTGDVAHTSGTVGAAMEALFHGVPAIATSQDARQDYALTARLTAQVVRQVLERPLLPGVILSINVPRGELKGIRAARMAGTYFGVEGFEEVGRRGDTVLYRSRVRGAITGGADTDTAAYLDGYATITPIRFDWTDPATLAIVERWGLSLEEAAAVR